MYISKTFEHIVKFSPEKSYLPTYIARTNNMEKMSKLFFSLKN